MASKFTAGMRNFVEVLNQMWDAFAAGPYNALPLTGGALTGPVASGSTIRAQQVSAVGSVIAGDILSQAVSVLSGPLKNQPAGTEYEVMRLGVGGSDGVNYEGFWTFAAKAARPSYVTGKTGYRLAVKNYDAGSNSYSDELFAIDGDGSVRIPLLKCHDDSNATFHVISPPTNVQGADILGISLSASFRVANGSYGNLASNAALILTNNTVTARSINAGGTINASGADYAEYMVKSTLCGLIAPGQIVGIDADGRLTDKWDRAITFMTKSTSPCIVGGDSWAQDLGAPPVAPTRIPPTVEQELVSPAVPADAASGADEIAAIYRTVVTVPGDTDAEWAIKEAEHAAALAAFDVALELRRQTVDRIAFAGQVPVNVLGATPGQYIVPVQEGEGIAGVAMHLADMSMVQYANAVGQVIAIEEDGRARIIVKAA